MPFALHNLNRSISVKLIDKPVDIINAAAPAITVAESLGLSNSVVSVSGNILEQLIYAPKRLFVICLPI